MLISVAREVYVPGIVQFSVGDGEAEDLLPQSQLLELLVSRLQMLLIFHEYFDSGKEKGTGMNCCINYCSCGGSGAADVFVPMNIWIH